MKDGRTAVIARWRMNRKEAYLVLRFVLMLLAAVMSGRLTIEISAGSLP